MKNLCGQHIYRLRRLRGWSQSDLRTNLKRVGLLISRPAIAKVELGSRCVSDFELVAFTAVFRVPVSSLLRKSRAKRGRVSRA